MSVKETKCGHWVKEVSEWFSNNGEQKLEDMGGKERWVSNTTTKRYCYPDKTLAMQSFKARKHKYMEHLSRNLRMTAEVLKYVEDKFPDNNVRGSF